ncbi:MAG: porin family protein [Bacteroidota bacterium]|nr:porin family protein [Bacteroidota bacterium]
MKHYLLSIIIVSFSSITGFAQSGSLWLGAHVGVDIGSIALSPPQPRGEEVITSRTGIAIGAEGDYWITDNLGMSIGLAYVQKGANDNLNGTPFVLDYKYLQMPVLLKVTFGSDPVKPFFFAGPEFGLKLSGKEIGKLFGRDTTVDLTDSLMPKFNIGILFGVGVTYSITPEATFFLEAGYDYGMSSVITPYAGGETEIFTRDLRASLGVLFRIE